MGVDVFEEVCNVELKSIAEKMLANSFEKENDRVIVWELSMDAKDKYKYCMDQIIGPFMIGKMVYQHFPNSLNAKYLRVNELITVAYIRQIKMAMNAEMIIPNSIIQLCERFFKTNL